METTPQGEWQPTAHNLRREFLEQRIVFRVFLVVILMVGVIGGLGGGFVLSREVHHWAAWAFALLFLEPVGLACLLSLVAFAAPDSFAAHFLDGALRRASRAAYVGVLVYLAIVAAAIVYAVFSFARG